MEVILSKTGKLVRDRIPEIIHAKGEKASVHHVQGAQFVKALKQKLMEEAQEAANAAPDHLVEEIADVQEVLTALKKAASIDEKQLREIQDAKRRERGGFEQGIILENP
jgi:predicted house-cleaning noncanonical NTP pyrophosphatase (MazG superfamily)